MLLNEASEIFLGNAPVQSIYKGYTLVWSKDEYTYEIENPMLKYSSGDKILADGNNYAYITATVKAYKGSVLKWSEEKTLTPEKYYGDNFYIDGEKIKAHNLGKTETDEVLQGKFTGKYADKETEEFTVKQQINEKKEITDVTDNLQFSADKYTSRSNPCPASGGEFTVSADCIRITTVITTWTSGEHETRTTTTHPDVVLSLPEGSPLQKVVNKTYKWPTRGITPGELRSAVINAETIDKKLHESLDVYQGENKIESTTFENFSVHLNWGGWAKGGEVASASGDTGILIFVPQCTQVDVYTSGAEDRRDDATWDPNISAEGPDLEFTRDPDHLHYLNVSWGENSTYNQRSASIKFRHGSTVIKAQEFTQAAKVATLIVNPTEKTVEALYNAFYVTIDYSGDSFEVKSNATWLSYTDDTHRIVVSTNNTGAQRVGTLTVTGKNGGEATITVTQNAE